LGLWVKGIREVYQRFLKHPSRMGQEKRGSVLCSNKLSELRIDWLESMGFKWTVIQRTVQASNDTQAINDLPVPAMPKADSTAPELVEHASAFLDPNPAPRIPAATKDDTHSPHRLETESSSSKSITMCVVPGLYTGGRGKNLAVWVIRIRERPRIAHTPNSLG
jgi:hypothetical protein